MGSIVFTSPALKLFKAQYPSCKIYFMTFNKNRGACELLNLTSNQYLLTVDESSLILIIIGILKNIIILRREKIDAVVDMEFFPLSVLYLLCKQISFSFVTFHIGLFFKRSFFNS